MEQEKSVAAAYAAASARVETGSIGTLTERTLHGTLKYWLQPNEEFHEVEVQGCVADIFDGEEITEVQTVGLYPLKKKLAALLAHYPVTVAVPVPRRKWVAWINPDTGESGELRRSPKTGKPWDVLPELFWISELWREQTAHPLTVRLLFVDLEEYRLQDGWGNGGKRGAHRADRRPLAVAEEMVLRGFADVSQLLPTLPEEFSAAVLQKALGRRGRTLWRATRFLEESGAIVRCGKQGRAVIYKKKERCFL